MPGPGLFGKLPETGDFIARGLAPALRRALDRWVTAHLAARRDGWPRGGARGLLELEDGLVLFVAVASRDSVGRRYPLLAVTEGNGLSLEDAETWCDAVAQALEIAAAGSAGVDQTMAALDAAEPEARDGPDGAAALWVAGGAPMTCDAATLDEIFSSG